MPYTFGAAATDYVSQTVPYYLGSNTVSLVAGWFNPSTLTAGRVLWATASGGQPNQLEIDTTTTQLKFTGSGNTTRSVYTLAGDPITTDRWWFYALAVARSGSGESVVGWLANETLSPVPMTVTTVTAHSGTFTTPVTTFFGNLSTTASLAFQGDIGPMTIIAHNNNFLGPLLISGSQTFTANERDMIQRSIVTPIWNSTIDLAALYGNVNQTNGQHWPMNDSTSRQLRRESTSLVTTSSLTISGPTVSQTRAPYADNQNFPYTANASTAR